MRTDYLAAFLAQAPVSFEIPTPEQVSKVSKGGSDTFDTAPKVEYPTTQTATGRGFDTFGTASRVAYPKLRKPNLELNSLKKQSRISPHTTSKQGSKVSKPIRRERVAKPRRRGKALRPTPLWQACTEATSSASGEFDVEAAGLLYGALALRDGHTSDEVCEMLRKVTPRAGSAADYCAGIVRRVSVNPTAHITTELAAKYVAAHPFAWELGLNPLEMTGVQRLT